MATKDNGTEVTLLTRRTLPDLDEVHSSRDTVALLADNVLSDSEREDVEGIIIIHQQSP